jgi:hypothetical protein
VAKRLPAEDQEKRDRRIAFESVRGLSVPHIALRHGVSQRTVHRALGRWWEHFPSLFEADAVKEVELELARSYAAIEELAELRGRGNPGLVRIRAIRAQMRIMKDIWELRQAMGLLPDFGSRQSRLHFAGDFWAWIRRRLEKEQGWSHDHVEFLHFLIEDRLANSDKANPPPLDL